MHQRTLIASVMIVGIVVTVGTAFILLGMNNALAQIPPPDTYPDNDLEVFQGESVEVTAEAIYSQNFMPIVDDDGPPFYVLVRINVTNTGDTTLETLNALRTTLYYNGTLTAFATLNLTLAVRTLLPITVEPGESLMIEFINDRSEVFSPIIDEGTYLYARVLFQWDYGKGILTTPPSDVLFTH